MVNYEGLPDVLTVIRLATASNNTHSALIELNGAEFDNETEILRNSLVAPEIDRFFAYDSGLGADRGFAKCRTLQNHPTAEVTPICRFDISYSQEESI